MAKKPKILSDEEIVSAVSPKSHDSVGWFDSKLAKEQARVIKYYDGTLPKRQHEGSSTYISTDVYDAVETMKAQLLETFAGGDEIAQFDPDTDMNVASCRVATQYASYVIFRQNDGFGVFRDVIHNGLMARAGIAKVYWEEGYEYSEETFEGHTHDDAYALAAQDRFEIDLIVVPEAGIQHTFRGQPNAIAGVAEIGGQRGDQSELGLRAVHPPVTRGAAAAMRVAYQRKAPGQLVEHCGQRHEAIGPILVDLTERHRLDQRQIQPLGDAPLQHRRDLVFVQAFQRDQINLDR